MVLPKELFTPAEAAPKFPMLMDFDKPEFSQQYPSLKAYLATRPEAFWQLAVHQAETPVSKRDGDQDPVHPLIEKVALAIRALDQGMIDLPMSKRLIYIYQYVCADISLTAENLQQLFPFYDSTQRTIIQARAAENGRLTRFFGYMEALQEIEIEKPDILLGSSMTSSRRQFTMYTELDFWVEQQVEQLPLFNEKAAAARIAENIPSEFLTSLQGTAAGAVKESLRYLSKDLERVDISFDAVSEKRFQIIDEVLTMREGQYFLSCTFDALAKRMGLTHRIAESTVKKYIASRGINLVINQGRPIAPTPETLVMVQHILEAHDALDGPGKKWKYRQLTTADIAGYIMTHYPDLGRVTPTMVKSLVENYLDESVTDHIPGMPTRRLASRDPESVRTAIIRDLINLIDTGHSQNPDALAEALEYSAGTRKGTRTRIRQLLTEIRDNNEATVTDEAFKPILSGKLTRRKIRIAILALEKKGFAWRHPDSSQRINSRRIAEELNNRGMHTTHQEVVTFLSNKRKTSQPVGDKMRPIIKIVPEVDRLLAGGMTDPELIIAELRKQQPLTRATEAKIRAHVLRPRIEAFIATVHAQRGTIPTLEEVKIHLGLTSTKIPSKVYRELGYL